MSNVPSASEVARELGFKDGEVLDVVETEAGLLAEIFDGTKLVKVDEDRPDADGQHGWLLFTAPIADLAKGYHGQYPVYAQPGAETAVLGSVTDDELPKPGASAEKILAYVAGDRDRAEAALEQEKEGKARIGLITELEAILAQYPPEPSDGDPEKIGTE